ncbi:omega-6 fatty acid desaturase (delta-12 desaturase) [Thalassococcus halodurans]|uniref:Omega-6 fatty acid desaturase (Delta-12 desaturase) n=1 Tax=Thalassococcus halodurans TaxID=373675 RepID=A0A1H6A706_9RHOB|nr:fatty acid desaturase [Thalassococcus halodurans]SEG44518.1 omega-6 fatty acid desaturase (delta-12 desaturase) [Thalassococcus halodurans]
MDTKNNAPEKPTRHAKDWVRILANYREPSNTRSFVELGLTLGPFFLLWALAWMALSISPWLALGLAVVNGMFLVRIFCIQHDCGHASFFKNRKLQDWVGRALGVLTLTPYDVWRQSHSIHHSSHGNLDQRGMGDILTLTVEEYRARGWWGRLMYRLYRHPLVLFVLGPSYIFILENRLPIGHMRSGWKFWISAMGTNAAMAILVALIIWFGGLMPFLLIYIPTSVIAATIGVWLFYVQHQFEETHWAKEDDWQLHEYALEGSSHYVLPQPLQWLSANIGIHHVHHLYSRIPFYRLPEVLRDHKELNDMNRLTPLESLKTINIHLWDEKLGRLLSFREARKLYGV